MSGLGGKNKKREISKFKFHKSKIAVAFQIQDVYAQTFKTGPLTTRERAQRGESDVVHGSFLF